MKRIVITIIACLAIAAFGIHTGNAAEPLKNCGNLDPMFIDVGDIIDCGIVQIGDSRNFKFDASEDDKIRLTMTDKTDGSPAPYLGLYDPDGVLISKWYVQNSGTHNDYSLTSPGEYTIVVWEYADNEAVDFRIALQRITPSPAEARSLSLDSQLDGDIDPFADSDVFIFDGTSGDKIRLTMTDMTSGSPAPYLGLYDPDGVLTSKWYVQDSGTHNDYSLTKTGRYTIVVWEYANNEAVNFRIALQGINPSPPGTLTLCNDKQFEDDIEPFADSDVFIFEGNIDDKIRLTMTDMTSGAPAPYLGLYDPDEVLISKWYVQNSGSHNDYSLTKTGRYTIVVWEYANNEAVTYRLSFNCILGECLECADFSANPTRGPAPLTASFTDQSTGSITSWKWDFGDGSTSTMQNPSHTYTDPGNYTVSLTVTGPEGSDTNTKADYIKVWSPVKAMPWIPLLLTDD